jgi:hypothetical protein
LALMTLDARKAARVVANRARIRAGRTIVVAAVYRTAYGGRTAQAVAVVLKQQATSAPEVVDQEGRVVAEYLAEWPIEIDPRSVAFVALTGGSLDDGAIAAAIQLEVVTYRRSGLVPDRWHLTLRRLR